MQTLLHRQLEVTTSWKMSLDHTPPFIGYQVTFGEVSQCSHVQRLLLTGKEFQDVILLVTNMGVWCKGKEYPMADLLFGPSAPRAMNHAFPKDLVSKR